MDPVTIGLIGSAAIGAMNQDKARIQQNDMAAQARDVLNSVPLPVLKEYYPELYKQVSQIAPEAVQAQELGQSEMAGIKTDPAMRQAQMNALLKMQEIGDQGGMTATDRARLGQIQGETESALKGQEGAIMQNLAARGMGGGSSELVARQLAAQGAANRMGQQGLDVKAQAEQRALQAIMQSGQLGGQMQSQDFSQQAQIASAKDAINRFNAQNLQNVASQNIQSRNQAQMQNAQNLQNIANQNVGLSNQAQQYNLNLPQQNFTNQIARATGQSTGLQQQAQLAAQQQAAQNQMIGGLVQTGAQYYTGQQNQQNKKQGEV